MSFEILDILRNPGTERMRKDNPTSLPDSNTLVKVDIFCRKTKLAQQGRIMRDRINHMDLLGSSSTLLIAYKECVGFLKPISLGHQICFLQHAPPPAPLQGQQCHPTPGFLSAAGDPQSSGRQVSQGFFLLTKNYLWGRALLLAWKATYPFLKFFHLPRTLIPGFVMNPHQFPPLSSSEPHQFPSHSHWVFLGHPWK